jgi:hypothetical protein
LLLRAENGRHRRAPIPTLDEEASMHPHILAPGHNTVAHRGSNLRVLSDHLRRYGVASVAGSDGPQGEYLR